MTVPIEIQLENAIRVCNTLTTIVNTGEQAIDWKKHLRIALLDFALVLEQTTVPLADDWEDFLHFEGSYYQLRAFVNKQFPSLDFYWWDDSPFDPAKEPSWSLGDAIDDLTDILLAIEGFQADRLRHSFLALYDLAEDYRIHLFPHHIPGLLTQLD